MRIAIIGTGYVGLVTGACFADFGNQVYCVDRNRRRLKVLKKGKIPFYEPGVLELVHRNVQAKRLAFSHQLSEIRPFPEIIMLAVGTPPRKNGEADIDSALDAARQIARVWAKQKSHPYFLIVTKSTVPAGTTEQIRDVVLDMGVPSESFSVASNPEFLREGSAISDFLNPDRIVIGGDPGRAFDLLAELYRPLNAHLFFTSIRTAELVKYASNAFLAMKISFINEMAHICERLKLDVSEVSSALGLDKRIGQSFLNAGLGYGGSCLPKDVNALIRLSEKAGYSSRLLPVVNSINDSQTSWFAGKIVKKLRRVKGKRIAVLGLSFKPGTDDVRESPALKVLDALLKRGAKVKAYDPSSEKIAQTMFPKAQFCESVFDAIRGTDAIVVATDWPEFRELDLNQVRRLARGALIFDGRNIFDPRKVRDAGIEYYGVGR